MYTFPRRGGYVKVTTGPIVIANAGSIFVVTVTELARLNVPSLPVPIELRAKCVIQNTAGASNVNLDAYMGIQPAGAVGAAVAAALSLDSEGVINVGGTTTEVPGRKLIASYWLPENSGGDYIMGVWREIGSDAGSVIANSLVPIEFSWQRG